MLSCFPTRPCGAGRDFAACPLNRLGSDKLGAVPSVRAIALALAATVLPLDASGQDSPVPAPPPSDWAVALQVVLGGGSFQDGAGARSGIAAGFDFLVRYRELVVGPFLAGGGPNGQDAVWYGVEAGWSHRLAEWVRLDLLAEGGVHNVSVESVYAGEVAGTASFRFVGARAGLNVGFAVLPAPQLFFARRVAFGIQIGARADLGRDTVQPGFPAGMQALPAVASAARRSPSE